MTSSGSRYLLFLLQGRRYALDLSQVSEVCEPPQLWPIPSAPACYAGAMNFHGTIVAVLDLAAFIGHNGYDDLEKNIVLAPEIAALSFLVERVIRIVPAAQVTVLSENDDLFSAGVLALPEGEAVLLDAAAVAARAAETING